MDGSDIALMGATVLLNGSSQRQDQHGDISADAAGVFVLLMLAAVIFWVVMVLWSSKKRNAKSV